MPHESKAVQYLMGHQWAMLPDHLERMMAIAQRIQSDPKSAREMLEQRQAIMEKQGDLMEGTRKVRLQDGVATVPIIGPICRYADMFSEFSGMTSLEKVAPDFQKAVDNPDAKAVLLYLDSPGGEVNGTSEFANMVYAARQKKPVVAYVANLGCSAAYWIASAASRIVVADTGTAGSIGVVATFRKRRQDNTIEIVSTQSPHKRPDIESDSGRATIQQHIDKLASVFIGAVAQYRGVDESTVISKYGQGGVFVGSDAVERGLADQVGTLESLVSEYSKPNKKQYSLGIMAESDISGYANPIALSTVADSDVEDEDEINAETEDTIVVNTQGEEAEMSVNKDEIQAMLKANNESLLATLAAQKEADQKAAHDASVATALKEAQIQLLNTKIATSEAEGKITPGQKKLFAVLATNVAGNPQAEDALVKLAASMPEHNLLKEQASTPEGNKLDEKHQETAGSPKAEEFDPLKNIEVDAEGSPMIPDSVLQDRIAHRLIAEAKAKGETMEYLDAALAAEKDPEFIKAMNKINAYRAIARS
jgi:ClpP class serine protease